jgi:hypothetical protein
VCHDSAGFAVVITVIPWSHGKSCYPIGKTRGALTGTWHFEFPIGMGKSKSNEASVTSNGDHELPRSHLSFSAAHCTVCLLLVSYGKSDVPCQYAVQRLCSTMFPFLFPSVSVYIRGSRVGSVNCLLTVTENSDLDVIRIHKQLSKVRTYRNLPG